MGRLGQNGRKSILCILLIGLWWGFSLYGFPSIFVFLLCSYVIIMCYNVYLDRDCICHRGVLWQQTLRWRSGSQMFIRHRPLWKEAYRKKDWAEAKFRLWCRHGQVLTSPAGSSVAGIACPSVLLRAEWVVLSVPSLLSHNCKLLLGQGGSLRNSRPYGRGQQLRLVLPIRQTWRQVFSRRRIWAAHLISNITIT